MKSRIFYSLLVVFCFVISVTAQQEKYIKHIVTQGETISSIAQKYKITPFDIYKYNPDSQNGIKPEGVLLIPASTVKSEPVVSKKEIQNSAPVYHTVQPKETLYGLSKQYNVPIDDIVSENKELLKEGLQIGQNLKIPSSKGMVVPKKESVQTNIKVVEKINSEFSKKETVYHVVEPKETKYGVSRKYGLTIEELERLNPQILTGFPIGAKLIVSEKGKVNNVGQLENEHQEATNANGKKYLQEYVVRPNQTTPEIANYFGMSEEELLELNPELKKGIKQGMIIRVPIISKKKIKKNREQGNLIKKINNNARKQLALFLPFNVTKIESDTVNTVKERLKKDKFLNLTLDFYSGVLMAIDSAKVMGLNIDIKIFDSHETKNTSNVETLVNENNLGNSDAIIGPFYQANVEKVAKMVSLNNTPVISPLSKDTGVAYPNIFQSMPTSNLMREAIFDYMKSKDGNIIALIDPKKESVKQYIKEFQKDVSVVGFTEEGKFVSDSLKVLLRKGKINYVVLGTERTSMILSTMSTLLKAQKDFQVQMVILEPNETLDFEEISLESLTKLHLLYPSLSKPNDSNEANKFDEDYKKINNVFPNRYAIRGFDVTFDTLVRLSQEESFEDTTKTYATERIESKFDYIENMEGGYVNNGIYIMYYDTDLTIKEAL